MLFLIFPWFSRPFFLGKAWEVHESKMATFPESFAHLIWKCVSWMWSSLIKLRWAFTFTLCACVFRSASDALVCLLQHAWHSCEIRLKVSAHMHFNFVGLCKRFQKRNFKACKNRRYKREVLYTLGWLQLGDKKIIVWYGLNSLLCLAQYSMLVAELVLSLSAS